MLRLYGTDDFEHVNYRLLDSPDAPHPQHRGDREELGTELRPHRPRAFVGLLGQRVLQRPRPVSADLDERARRRMADRPGARAQLEHRDRVLPAARAAPPVSSWRRACTRAPLHRDLRPEAPDRRVRVPDGASRASTSARSTRDTAKSGWACLRAHQGQAAERGRIASLVGIVHDGRDAIARLRRPARQRVLSQARLRCGPYARQED